MSTAHSTQVGRTTIIYILIPLAISTMAQPVGSVLGSNPISKDLPTQLTNILLYQYLRLFPRHYPLSIVPHYLLPQSCEKSSREKSYRHTAETTETLQTVYRGAFLCWVFFVLGAHGCILKLSFARGIPWTQVWGFSYVVAFVVFEVMIWFALRITRQRVPYLWTVVDRNIADLPSQIGITVALAINIFLLWYALFWVFASWAGLHLSSLIPPWQFNQIKIGNDYGIEVARTFVSLAWSTCTPLCNRSMVIGIAKDPNMRLPDNFMWRWPLELAIGNLTLSLLWYERCYYSIGTVIPSWTKKLG